MWDARRAASRPPSAGRSEPATPALKAAMEKIPAKEISAQVVQEQPIPYGSRRADALAYVAESFLAGSGTSPVSSPSSNTSSRASSSTADRYQVVVHVDAESLREHSDGRCEIEQGPSIPVATARRLTCDASLLSVLENEHGSYCSWVREAT